MRKLLCILGVACMALAVTACSDTSSVPSGGGSGETVVEESSQVTKSVEPAAVGDTVEVNGLKMTLLGVRTSTGSPYAPPTTGNTFLLCDFDIENTSSEEITISSIMSASAYCDGYSCDVDLQVLLADDAGDSLDGPLAPGKKMKGSIGFQVPMDWSEFEFHFVPDFLSDDEIVFVVDNE